MNWPCFPPVHQRLLQWDIIRKSWLDSGWASSYRLVLSYCVNLCHWWNDRSTAGGQTSYQIWKVSVTMFMNFECMFMKLLLTCDRLKLRELSNENHCVQTGKGLWWDPPHLFLWAELWWAWADGAEFLRWSSLGVSSQEYIQVDTPTVPGWLKFIPMSIISS